MTTERAINDEMVARGYVRDRSETKALRYLGAMDIRENSIRVAVTYIDRELTKVPKLSLLNREKDMPDVIAHFEANGNVCYVNEEQILLDPLKPRETVARCLIKMNESLDRAFSTDLSEEITQEFPQHWLGSTVYCNISKGFSGNAGMYALREGTASEILLITNSKKAFMRFGLSKFEIKNIMKLRLPVHVVSTEQQLTFINGQSTPNTFLELLEWLDTIDTSARQTLLNKLPTTVPSPMQFLICAPNGIVGGSIELPPIVKQSIIRPKAIRRILLSHAGRLKIDRITGNDVSIELISRRNMPDTPNLNSKKIAIIGIGTIGGFLSKLLAQTGAGLDGGLLYLIDTQVLEAGNIGRHFLGPLHIGKNKAQAMKEELSRIAPDSEVMISTSDALESFNQLLDFDLVLDATGEQAFSDVLNRRFVSARQKEETETAVLHCWLLGSGIAAQAILVESNSFACYRCSRQHSPGKERFRTLRPEHPAHLIPAACGEGSYFAYGAAAPSIAAGLAAQMCFDWVNNEPSPRFRTLSIVPSAVFSVKDSDPAPLSECPVCSVSQNA